MTGKWLLEYGVRDSCIESLPDWNCDLRLSGAAPAPTLQEGSTRKERKGNTALNFHCSFVCFEGSPLDKSTWKKRDRETTAPVIDFILLRYRAGLRKVETG